MIPHEREMVERLKDKPFTLVGISLDAKKETLTDFLAKEKMPWTHWWVGATSDLAEDWEVHSIPTIYVVDAKGKQVHARTFIKFDTAMASPTVPGAHYDMARNWAFVQELLTDPVARVSHIFIAEWIRHELLAYAKPRSSHALWERAALVMMQPHNSLPHDDHIHVRISCPREARSSCIELAKPAPHGHLAHKGAPGGRVLHTPPHAHPASHAASHKAPAASAVTRDVPALPVAPPEGDEPGFDVGGDSAID